MIQVMIVDDMPIFREYLRKAIDWSAYGFEICCEAKNGQEALELMAVYEPDIVLSDITMPFMDGLELSKALKKTYDQTEVVLITGNAEFEYAKKAVKLGVADYIVKPFEKEELIVTLLSLKDNIEKVIEQGLSSDDDDQLYMKMIYASDIVMADDKFSDEQYFYVTVIDTQAPLKEHEYSEQAMRWKSVIGSLYKDFLPLDSESYLFKDYEERMILLNVMHEFSEYDTERDEMDDLIDLIKEKLNLDVTIGIGQIHQGISGVRTSYLEALNALNNRFLYDGNRVIHYKQTVESGYKFYSAELNEDIIRYLDQLKKDAVLNVIHHIFTEAEDKQYNIEYKKMISMGLISLLLSYVVKIGKHIDDIFESPFKPYFLIQQGSDDSLEQFIVECYETVLNYLNHHKTSQTSVIASQAKKCIESNYHDPDFSMKTMTKSLLVNQTYLRKMFKSEYNMTISEYLVQVRMVKAKQLIQKGHYKLSAVAEMVGYNDAGYFSRSFKKYFGVSPSEYR